MFQPSQRRRSLWPVVTLALATSAIAQTSTPTANDTSELKEIKSW